MKTLNKKRDGFSLTEAMIATVVLGIAAAGILLPFTSGAAVQEDGVRRTLAVKLAGELMESIVATPFEQIVDIHNDYLEPQGYIKDSGGEIFAGVNYAKLSRYSTCEYVYTAQESGTETAGFILATVRVYYDDEQIAIIRRLISR